MKVRKAVIAAAGLGVRFLPATKVLPKEMLPIRNKPVIQWAVEEAVAAGIEHIIIVTSQGKQSIEDHFDCNHRLEEALRKNGNVSVLEEVRAIGRTVKINYVRQREQLGLGHAVLMAEDLVGREPFALILPDDLVKNEISVTRQLLDVFEDYNGNILGVEDIPPEKVSSYGIIDPLCLGGRLYEVIGLVEKPDVGRAPSSLGIVGRYVLKPEIFEALRKTPPGRGGEIQLTDGLAAMRGNQKILAYRFEGERHDVGTPLGLLKASIAFALDEPQMKQGLIEYLARVGIRETDRSPLVAGPLAEPGFSAFEQMSSTSHR